MTAPDTLYDVFISYSHADATWVWDWLRPRLEAAGLHVCLDRRDFDIGVPSLVNMERAVDHSRHTLLVLTPAWVDSEWTAFEELLTQTADPAARRRRLIPLLLQPCQPPRRIAMLTYADFTQQAAWDTGLQRVIAAVQGELHLPELGPPLREQPAQSREQRNRSQMLENVFQAERDQYFIQVSEKPQESPDLSLSVDTLDQNYLWKDGSQAQIREVLVRIENNGKATAFEIMPCIRVEDESEVWFDAENFRETGKVYELPAKKFLAFPIFENLARNSARIGIQAIGLDFILERKFKLTAHFQYRHARNDSRVYETPTSLFEWSWYQPDILREEVKVKIYNTLASYRSTHK
jgi:hypothetical protein